MKVIPVPCHFDNYAYVLVCEQTGEAAVIDPAEYYPVRKVLENLEVTPTAVFCTHHHADHIGGLEEFCVENQAIKVYGYGGREPRIKEVNHTVGDNNEVVVGNCRGRVFYTPGHTSDSVCLHIGNTLFTGDTLFGAGCGRLFEGSPSQMYSSLVRLTENVPADTEIYFGHEYTLQNLRFAQFVEPENEQVARRAELTRARRDDNQPTCPATLAVEFATNPFLRCRLVDAVEQVAKNLFLENRDPVAVFTALRKLKDSF
ncbi:hydroxyacylglutathione hydrolase [Desulforhopalus singaporensis]|uniref:Hydroxyacylglutathione hydrolase n=1 Tax=Desulforhopalus singaporensis TaxID=91360 RepID=A0A1H0UGK5_9BACT|nr:hydroxyacylglutathione hydrolase [Desulforhopalus singaporensis]SDP65347.1 hydroxyacylglutathione hydrolase [Desulforhopalus singaporensis]